MALSCVVFLGGCDFLEKSKPSVLVIAVENLGFGEITCSNVNADQTKGGFETFCNEAVRFSHAYGTSPLSQPTLTSILTAQYPSDHGITSNGNNFLSAKKVTVAERALEQGFATYFTSGGPPIFRKSGLHQGFQKFVDGVNLKLDQLYTPVDKVFSKYIDWVDGLEKQKSHFSVLYISDLQFENVPTVNNLGEERESTYRGQKAEVDESLETLVKALKTRKKWDSSYVVLVGLNSKVNSPRLGEVSGLNLYSEKTHISLFIKPARKTRDGPFTWKIDKNVSVTDLGATLFEVVEEKPYRSTQSQLPIISLKEVLSDPRATWDENRPIMVSSSWPDWMGIGKERVSIRKGHYLLILDDPYRLYNTLTDRLETVPIPESDEKFVEFQKTLTELFSNRPPESWKGLPSIQERKIRLAKGLWSKKNVSQQAVDELEFLLELSPKDQQLVAWAVRLAMVDRDWQKLLTLGRKYNNPLWVFVARRNLSLKVKRYKTGCRAYFTANSMVKSPSLRECDNLVFLDLLNWVNADPKDTSIMRERFLRKYEQYLLKLKLAQLNYINELTWDISTKSPSIPSLAELYLKLPENSRYYKIVKRRLLKKF